MSGTNGDDGEGNDYDFDKHVYSNVERARIIATGTVGDDDEANVESFDFEYDKDALRSVCSSDNENEEIKSKYKKYLEFNAAAPHFKLGMRLTCVQDVKKSVNEYGMKHHRVIQFLKNDIVRMRVACTKYRCP